MTALRGGASLAPRTGAKEGGPHHYHPKTVSWARAPGRQYPLLFPRLAAGRSVIPCCVLFPAHQVFVGDLADFPALAPFAPASLASL